MLVAVGMTIVTLILGALRSPNRTIMLRTTAMMGISAAVILSIMYFVGWVIPKINAPLSESAATQPPVGRVTSRFVLLLLASAAAIAAGILNLARSSGPSNSFMGIVCLIFMAPWLAYSAVREYRRSGNDKAAGSGLQ
ncbi:MAG TPA: hypothetical protein VLM42_13925 [Bryobacteraceae bacterium]|nr:hypothetical protein [Bryobacteraceae bacterium]